MWLLLLLLLMLLMLMLTLRWLCHSCGYHRLCG